MTTTDTQSALLAAILADPADDTARLVYADWLEENDQPDRAAFIRVQVELARWPGCDWTERRKSAGYRSCSDWNSSLTKGGMSSWCPSCISRTALRARERELFGNAWKWIPSNFSKMAWSTNRTHTTTRHFLVMGEEQGESIDLAWSRGFPTEAACTSADWLRHHEALYWRPGQTMKCRCRGEYGEWNSGNCRYRCNEYPCDPHTGRVPRPMAPGAQPIERVVLTTEPDWPMGWDESALPTGTWRWVDPNARQFTCDRWPGIVFEVRPAHPWQSYRTDYRDMTAEELAEAMRRPD